MIIAPSKPAEKNAMRSYPYGKRESGGLTARYSANAANPTATTWITDSAASERMAAEPVSRYALALPASIATPTSSDSRIAKRVWRRSSAVRAARASRFIASPAAGSGA